MKQEAKRWVQGRLRSRGYELVRVREERPQAPLPVASSLAVDLHNSFDMLVRLGLDVHLVVDVGAHMGGWTAEALTYWGQATYLLVEPQTDLPRDPRLQLNDERVRWFHVGAGPTSGEMAFFTHERADSSSFQKSQPSRTLGQQTLPVVRIDELVRSEVGDRIPDVIKLDCEGWDLEVVKGIGSLLGQTPCIFLEAGAANPLFSNTVDKSIRTMRELGYALINVAEAARNPHTLVMWNAELCFVLDGGELHKRARTWVD